MKATELKSVLEKAIDRGIITCNGINCLRCPAAGYELVHGRCYNEQNCNSGSNTYICDRGDKRNCVHRLDIKYTDKSIPNTLWVKYRIYPGVKDGFIDCGDTQLCEVFRKIHR